MAQGPKGAEMGPTGPRIDSAGRSGVGWYVQVSGPRPWPQRAKPEGCHTLPYVALCSTACSVVHVRRSALTEAPFS